jgi:hypothetical protein
VLIFFSNHSFDVDSQQSLALILNGMSGLGVRDTALMDHLAQAAVRLSPSDVALRPQHLANIVNAYARSGHVHQQVFVHLAGVIIQTAKVRNVPCYPLKTELRVTRLLACSPPNDFRARQHSARQIFFSHGPHVLTLGLPLADQPVQRRGDSSHL